MNNLEKRTAVSLAAVYAVRMLGLFMILPVFTLYAENIPNITPFMIGLTIGIYGLTQALLQIPLGLLSDKMGRKPVIAGGLLLFAIGSVIAALANNIEILILGRAIQGSGAIAAATMALAADLTREEHRAKVMAVIGMTIGVSFGVAMVIGPLISEWAGLSGIFWVTTGLAFSGILLILFVVPQPPALYSHRDAGIIKGYLSSALRDPTLIRMNIGVFILHMILSANFTVIPLIFRDTLGLVSVEHWKIYLPVLLVSFTLSIPFIIIAEKYHKIKPLFITSISVLIIAQMTMGLMTDTMLMLLLGFLLFFIGFNFLEAVQPSLVAKYSNVNNKGTAMGVFSTAQFLGIFAGGTLGGLVSSYWGIQGVLLFGAIVAALWLLVALGLPQPQFYQSRIFKLNPNALHDPAKTAQLLAQVAGVKESALSLSEGVAYLKVDKDEFKENNLKKFLE
ncbi:MAG TPA: MFS transporter [Leucothrix mucor]|uniref:MFS transporter n=1 Tax=Leucothrix mucor TaxID=45248 RepID=A0A7V2T1K3_LEUMU|nr:MFS transporter [Leucothrix mucor]